VDQYRIIIASGELIHGRVRHLGIDLRTPPAGNGAPALTCSKAAVSPITLSGREDAEEMNEVNLSRRSRSTELLHGWI